jgi:hypothetical protein
LFQHHTKLNKYQNIYKTNHNLQILLGSATVGGSGIVYDADLTGSGSVGCKWYGDYHAVTGQSVSGAGDVNGDG